MSDGGISRMVHRAEGLIENYLCGEGNSREISQAFSDIQKRVFSEMSSGERNDLRELRGRIEILTEVECSKEDVDMNLIEKGGELSEAIGNMSSSSASVSSASSSASFSGPSVVSHKIQEVERQLDAYTGEKEQGAVLSKAFGELLSTLQGDPDLSFKERGSLMQLQDSIFNFRPRAGMSELKTVRFSLFSRLGELEEKISAELKRLTDKLVEKNQNGTLNVEDINRAAETVKEAYASCIVDVFDKKGQGLDVANKSKLAGEIQSAAEKIKNLSNFAESSNTQSAEGLYEHAKVQGLLSDAGRSSLWQKNRFGGIVEEGLYIGDPQLCNKLGEQLSAAILFLKEKIRTGKASLEDVKDIRKEIEKAYYKYAVDVSSSKEELMNSPVRRVLLDAFALLHSLSAEYGKGVKEEGAAFLEALGSTGSLLTLEHENELWAGKLVRVAFQEPYGFVLDFDADVRAGTALAEGLSDAEATPRVSLANAV